MELDCDTLNSSRWPFEPDIAWCQWTISAHKAPWTYCIYFILTSIHPKKHIYKWSYLIDILFSFSPPKKGFPDFRLSARTDRTQSRLIGLKDPWLELHALARLRTPSVKPTHRCPEPMEKVSAAAKERPAGGWRRAASSQRRGREDRGVMLQYMGT